MPVITDNIERAARRVNGMKVAVSRMLARANYLAQNAVAGTFPSVQPMTEPMGEAVAARKWQPLFDQVHTLNVQQRDDHLF